MGELHIVYLQLYCSCLSFFIIVAVLDLEYNMRCVIIPSDCLIDHVTDLHGQVYTTKRHTNNKRDLNRELSHKHATHIRSVSDLRMRMAQHATPTTNDL